MSDEALDNFDRRFKMGADRNWARWKGHFESMVTHAFGAEKQSEEEQGNEYLLMAGDIEATKERYNEWAKEHGPEMAKTMLVNFWKGGRKYVDALVADGKRPPSVIPRRAGPGISDSFRGIDAS